MNNVDIATNIQMFAHDPVESADNVDSLIAEAVAGSRYALNPLRAREHEWPYAHANTLRSHPIPPQVEESLSEAKALTQRPRTRTGDSAPSPCS